MDSRRSARLKALNNQIKRLETQIIKRKVKSRRLSWYRLIIFLTGAFITILTLKWGTEAMAWGSVLLTLVVFNFIAYFHRKIEKSLKKHEIWHKIKSSQIARMNLDWENIPETAKQSYTLKHPFENDLDIIGHHSLHQLINTSISHEGSDLLTEWLFQEHPESSNIEKRQNIIKELVPLSRFRNKLLLNFYLITDEQLEGKKLLKWLNEKNPSNLIKKLLPISTILVFLNALLFVLHYIGAIQPYWIITMPTYIIFYLVNQKTLSKFFFTIFHLDEELGKFRQILKYLEKFNYGTNKHLLKLCAPFLDKDKLPSKQLRKIKLVTAAIGLRMNPILTILLNAVMPWDFYFANLISKYRYEIENQLPEWLKTWAELEALISLANFSYLNPEYVFPEIYSYKENKTFSTQNMGHPLIKEEQKICNDFELRETGEIDVITGSNMAGKSTFLKTIGINLCLAYSGSVVTAENFRIPLLRIFTCIKINDSVTEGFSFFYAEVKRLKFLLDALKTEHEYPIIFLIDEIFKGTNNKERLIGSRSFIKALVEQYALGLVSTHDLELAKLADQFPQINNFHFREEVIDGKMEFDFKLRQGPCPTTNALKIMKLEGLPVDE